MTKGYRFGDISHWIARVGKTAVRVACVEDERSRYDWYNGMVVETSFEGCPIYLMYLESLDATIAFCEGDGAVYIAAGRALTYDAAVFRGTRVEDLVIRFRAQTAAPTSATWSADTTASATPRRTATACSSTASTPSASAPASMA